MSFLIYQGVQFLGLILNFISCSVWDLRTCYWVKYEASKLGAWFYFYEKIKLGKNEKWGKWNVFRTDNTFRKRFWPYQQNNLVFGQPEVWNVEYHVLMDKAHFFATTDHLLTKLQSLLSFSMLLSSATTLQNNMLVRMRTLVSYAKILWKMNMAFSKHPEMMRSE